MLGCHICTLRNPDVFHARAASLLIKSFTIPPFLALSPSRSLIQPNLCAVSIATRRVSVPSSSPSPGLRSASSSVLLYMPCLLRKEAKHPCSRKPYNDAKCASCILHRWSLGCTSVVCTTDSPRRAQQRCSGTRILIERS